MDELNTLTKPFADAILPLVAGLRTAPTRSKQGTALKGTLQHLIRKYHDMLEDDRPPSASAAALALALSVPVDLLTLTWRKQTHFDPGRMLFHFEHLVPVSEIIRRCGTVNTAAEVRGVLDGSLTSVWITKQENAQLDALGYKSCRPDPRAAYDHAGIVVDPWPVL